MEDEDKDEDEDELVQITNQYFAPETFYQIKITKENVADDYADIDDYQ